MATGDKYPIGTLVLSPRGEGYIKKSYVNVEPNIYVVKLFRDGMELSYSEQYIEPIPAT
jgi:hypothetical protein